MGYAEKWNDKRHGRLNSEDKEIILQKATIFFFGCMVGFIFGLM